MVLNGSDAPAAAQAKEAQSASGRSPEPSFASLPQHSRWRARSGFETSDRTTQKPSANHATPGGLSSPVPPSMRRADHHAPTLLLVACAFVLGGGAAVAATYLLGPDSALLQMRRLPWMASQRESADRVEVPPSAASSSSGSMRSLVDKQSRDPRGQNQPESVTESQELTKLRQQGNHQLGDGRLEQPTGDNALETYRQLVAIAPHAAATGELGDRLSVKFWTLAIQARAAEKWDDALHYFDILKTLPAVPLAAMATKGDSKQAVPDLTRAAVPTPSPSDGAARRASANEVGAPAPVAKPTVAGPARSAALAVPPSVPSSRQDPPPKIGGSPEIAKGGPGVPSPSAAPAVNPEQTRTMVSAAMAQGDDAMSNRDILTARRFYELAASGGSAQAATAVGRTYDPSFLRGKGIWGILANADAAKRWYEKGISGGDAEARSRLEKLLKGSSNANQ
jgi:hypothetical protein